MRTITVTDSLKWSEMNNPHHSSSSLFEREKNRKKLQSFFFFYLYVHTMFGSFLPPSPHLLPYPTLAPSLSLSSLLLPGRNYFALISNFVEERV
jgi:hypothetical protein